MARPIKLGAFVPLDSRPVKIVARPERRITASTPLPATVRAAAPPEVGISPVFAPAPLRYSQVTAKVSESAEATVTGDAPHIAVSDVSRAAVTEEARGKNVVAFSTDGDKQELESAALRPQVSARPVYQPDFEIPAALRSQKLDTSVLVQVRVDAEGNQTPTLLRGSGIPALDAAIPAYLRRWRWEPARHNGGPVASVLRLTLPIKTD